MSPTERATCEKVIVHAMMGHSVAVACETPKRADACARRLSDVAAEAYGARCRLTISGGDRRVEMTDGGGVIAVMVRDGWMDRMDLDAANLYLCDCPCRSD